MLCSHPTKAKWIKGSQASLKVSVEREAVNASTSFNNPGKLIHHGSGSYKPSSCHWIKMQHINLSRNSMSLNAADSASRLDMSNIQGALACEQLADFIISRDGKDGKAYMLDSCCHYSTWGATSKVLSLQRKHSVDKRLLELDFSTGDSSQTPSGLPDHSTEWSPSLQPTME